jgi:amino-acid N-acetyltransferase
MKDSGSRENPEGPVEHAPLDPPGAKEEAGGIVIRKALVSDVYSILELLNGFATSQLILPRGPQYLYENIRDFAVAVLETPAQPGAGRGEDRKEGQEGDQEKDPDLDQNKDPDPDREKSRSTIVACGSLHVMWEDLAEIRSLVTREEYQRCGLGRRMVEFLENEARQLGVKKLFAFTLVEEFFRALGFERKEREELPEKLWGECSWCPKYFKCNEIGMILEI